MVSVVIDDDRRACVCMCADLVVLAVLRRTLKYHTPDTEYFIDGPDSPEIAAACKTLLHYYGGDCR